MSMLGCVLLQNYQDDFEFAIGRFIICLFCAVVYVDKLKIHVDNLQKVPISSKNPHCFSNIEHRSSFFCLKLQCG